MKGSSPEEPQEKVMVGRSGGYWRQVIMAGMFYSLQEAIEKLNKTEEEIKQIVADGKLREFRDGASLLFKVEEVEALMSDAGDAGDSEIEEILEPEALEPEALEPETLEPEALELDAPEADSEEPVALDFDDLEPEVAAEDLVEAELPELDLPDLDIPAADDTGADIPDLDSLEAEMLEPESLEPEAPAPSDSAADTGDILLAPETGAPAMASDLTDADTAITSFGTNVLGETGSDYDIADDTMAETAVPLGTSGASSEVPLEEIEEDLNLDSFGSGSGLLDLSLQADDTSLGGILDEIYTAEDDAPEPVAPEADADSAVGMAAEAEDMVPDDDFAAPEMAAPAVALARPLIDAPPDAQSNTLGMLLFLPLLIVIYTTVVAISGLRGVMPSILESIQGFIWFIMGGAGALAIVVAAAAFLFTGERDASAKKAKKPKKAKKAKKEKKPKKVKEKKPKKEKKAKK